MSTTNPHQLSAMELRQYREDGLAVPRYRLPQELPTRMRNSLDAFIEKNPGTPSDQLFTPHLRRGQAQGLQGDRSMGGIHAMSSYSRHRRAVPRP